MSQTQTIWAVVEHEKPLQKIEIPIPEPSGKQVLIKVTHCGVCHSDLHFWDGYYDLGQGKKFMIKDRGVTLPRACGHEFWETSRNSGLKPRASQLAHDRLCILGLAVAAAGDAFKARTTCVPSSKSLG